MKKRNWREDYVMVQTWNKEFEMIRHRWVHISVEDPVRYVLDFYPDEVIMP